MAFLPPLGFDGPLYEVGWAKLASVLGAKYAVEDVGDWKVTAVAGNRQVAIAAGSGLGCGVLVATDSSQVRTLPTPAAGQWHLVAARRMWDGNTTDFVVIPGITTTAMVPTAPPASFPADRKDGPGTVDDQPLAWVWVNASNTSVLIFDFREFPPNVDHPSYVDYSVVVNATGAVVPASNENTTVTSRKFWVPRKCTLRVDLSSDIWLAAANVAGNLRIYLDGVEAKTRRFHSNGRGPSRADLSTWLSRDISAGEHEVIIRAQVDPNSGGPIELWYTNLSIFAK